MTRVAFIQNMAFEYLGIMSLSALLKEHGHAVDIFIVKGNEGTCIEEIAAFQPDLIGFSCTTGMHHWALQFAAKVKESIQGQVIFGGPHATYFPEVIHESPVDIICRGEGEHALLEIAEKIRQGVDIKDTLSCWFKTQESLIIKNEQRTLVDNLDELPYPDRDLYIKKYPFLKRSQKAFMSTRGCPFDCTFCFNHAYVKLYRGKGKIVRFRSVQNVIDEIRQVKERHGLKTVYMQDDTFIVNKQWVREFTDQYRREIGLPFVCLIRADLADEETILRLRDAGCKNVFFGIETGSEELRNVLLKKHVTEAQIRNTANLLKRNGIRFRTYNMIGLPRETLEDAFKTVTLNAEIGTHYPWCSLFYPFPGTELAKYAHENGLLDDAADSATPSFFKNSVLKSEHKRELVNLQKLFFYGVKFPQWFPLIKKLIHYKSNIFFDLAFLAGYGWCYLRSENLSIRETFSVAVRNVRMFFFSKKDA